MADVLKSEPLSIGESVPMRFRQWYLPDRDKARKWREEAQEDFDFVASRQYNEDELKTLAKRKRPAVVFNRIGPIIDSITGYEIGNRREVRFIPREMGDVQPNELLTGAAQWFRDEGYGDYADSAMFASSIICGMGWTETRLNFDEGPNPIPIIEELDPFEMVWDRDARQRNLRDARRVWRVRRIPLAEAQAMWPGKSKNELHAAWSEVTSEADLGKKYEISQEGGDDNDYVTIVQCQWVEKEAYYVIIDPMTQAETELSVEEFNTVSKRMKALMGIDLEAAKFSRKVRKQAFFGEVVLSYGPAPCNDQFSLQCVTAKYDRNTGSWYGVVRAMKDPQRWANKWLAQMMHVMNANAKGGIMAEKGAFADPRKAEAEWSQPDSVTILNDGAIAGNMVKEKPQAQFPVGFQQLTEFAISSIRDVSGVSVEMLGMREANQAASLEMQRRQAGMNILQPLFDGLKLYRQMQGEVILYYLQHDVPEGTLVRVVGKDSEQYVPLARDAKKQFDIIVDDAPTSPNQKEQIWGVVASMLPIVGTAIPPQFILKALKYSPLPASVVQELEDMAKAPNPQAQEEAAMRARAAAAQIAETESKTQLNQAKAQGEMADIAGAPGAAQAEMAKTGMEMQVSRAEFEQRMAEIAANRAADEARHAAEMEKIGAQVMATRANAMIQRQARSDA